MDVIKMKKQMNEAIAKTIVAIQPYLTNDFHIEMGHESANTRAFQLIGIDILIDEHGGPWLMEINANPSFNMFLERVVQMG